MPHPSDQEVGRRQKVTRAPRVDFDERPPAPDESGRFEWDRFCRVNNLDSETFLGSRL